MKHCYRYAARALCSVAGMLFAASAFAADADVTGLVPTVFMDFEESSLANKGSASISFKDEGTKKYSSGANGGYALDTSSFTPYTSSSGSFSTVGEPITVSAVMTLGTNPNGITLNVRSAAGDLIIRRGADAGSLVIGFGPQSSTSTAVLNATFADGDAAWHLVSVVAGSTGTGLYVDGVLVDSTANTTLWSASGVLSDMQFGSHFGGLKTGDVYHGGCIDDLRIHAAALTTVQMTAIAAEYGIIFPSGYIAVRTSGEPEVGKNSFSTQWSLVVGSDDVADAAIVYGTDSSLSSPTTNALGSALSAGDYAASITGLATGTTYWWKIVASNGVEWAESDVASFRTLDEIVPSAFTKRIPITISGYGGTETLTNFPVLVKLAAGSPIGFDPTECAADGSDIRFAAADGTILPHEIDTWNANGESFVWVGVPALTNGTTFTMYYGSADPGATSTDNLWSLAGYAGVWHLTDGHDSTANGLDGTIVSGISGATDSKLGGALDFANTRMSVGTTPNSVLANGFSIEAWCYPRSLSKTAIFGKNTSMSVRIEDSSIRVTTPSVLDHDPANCSIAANEWFHLGLTFLPNPATDGNSTVANQYKVYRDGYRRASLGASRIPNLSSSDEMWIGGNKWTDQSFNGIIDEFRLSYSIRSADWIKAAYDTAASPAAFAVLSPVESTDAAVPRLGALAASDENGAVTFSVELALPGYGGAVPTSVSVFYGTDGENWMELPLGATNEVATLTGTASGFAGNARVLWYATAMATQGGTDKTATSAHRSFVTRALDPVGNYKSFTATVDWDGEPAKDIPVALRISEAAILGFSYADVTESVFEIVDANGYLLPYDIDTWNTNGESLLWVKMPSYADGATITVRYGTAFANARPAATEVWSAYIGVWHMNEILEDTSGKHYTPDSSASGWHAYKAAESDAVPAPVTTATGVTANPTPLTGTAMNIGYGTGKSNDNLGGFVVPTNATSSTTLNGPGFTLSAIVNAHHKATDGRCRVIAFGNNYNEMANLAVGYDNIYCMGSNEHHMSNPGGATNWVCLTAVYGSSSFIYADGTNLSGSGGNPNLPSLTLAKGIGLGCFTDGKQCLNGYLDEVRIRNASSTAEYIAAEYHAMADDAALVLSAVVSSDTSAPVLGTPLVVRNADGTFTVSVEVGENAPETIVCTIGGTDYPMTTETAAVPATYSATISNLSAGTHTASVRASSASGTTVSAACPTAFHAGALVVEAVSNADEGTLTPGLFRISRADADATNLPALTFDVAFSGEGLAAIVAPAVTTLTIPAGESSVETTITPVYTPAVAADTTVALAVSGAFIGTPSSGSMTIVNADYDISVRYVATTGDDVNHGGTTELPKKTIAAAVSSLANVAQLQTCTVHVTPGLYKISSPIVVTNAIHIIGDDSDPSCVVVSNTVDAGYYTQDQRIFRINHPDALVANLTMQHGQACGNGGNIYIGSDGGMVSNCVVEAGYTRDNGKAGGAWLDAGVVTHTVFRKNNTNSGSIWWNSAPSEGVLHLGGSSRTENCLFTENSQWVTVTLVSVRESATLRNCSILNSGLSATNADYSVWSALKIDSGATVQNVVIAGVTNTIDGAACPPTGAVANFQNGAFDGDVTGLPTGTITGTAAEFFEDYANGGYTPSVFSPLANAGVEYEGMASVDLAGNPRNFGKGVDIGCYECQKEKGFFIFVR